MSTKWAITFICAIAFVKAQNGYSRDNPSNQLGYNPFGQAISEDNRINGDEIPGEAGRDYPIYDKVPDTGFSCNNQQYPGYYADPESQCQAFYICQKSGRGVGFLCPNGTVFNQELLVCDWWYNFDCSRAEELYSVNEQVVRAMEEADQRLRQQQGGYNYDAPGSSKNGGYQNGALGQLNGNQGPSSTYGVPSNNGDNYRQNAQGSNGRNVQNSLSPVYGVPGQSPGSTFGQFRNSNNRDGYSSRQNGNRPSQSYGVPSSNGISSQKYSSNGNGNGRYTGNGNGRMNANERYRGNGFNGNSPKPVYGPPTSSSTLNAGIQYSPENGQYSDSIRGNGNSGYRNGNENGRTSPSRTYLPSNLETFNEGNGYNNGNGNGNYNGNGQVFRNGLGNAPTNLDRSYLPPNGNGFSNGNSPSSQYGVPGQGNGISEGYNGNGPSGQGFNVATPDRSYLPPSK